MPRYYFDVRDDDDVTPDEDGLVFHSLEAVKEEAARALAEIARDVIPGAVRRVLAIEVRDEAKRPLLEARMVFEIVPIPSAPIPCLDPVAGLG
jgi:hypothetical protein